MMGATYPPKMLTSTAALADRAGNHSIQVVEMQPVVHHPILAQQITYRARLDLTDAAAGSI